MSQLVKVTPVAEKLGLTPQQVYMYAREGIIPCVRIGRTLRFPLNKIEEFIEQGGKALPGGWRKQKK